MPDEAVFAFSAKHGRHIIPIDTKFETCNNFEGTQSFLHDQCLSLKVYPPCNREKCSTCQFVIPPLDIAGEHGHGINSNPIDSHLRIISPIHGKSIDLTRFYNTCAPNLPPNLCCPICRNSRRTLVLSITSYPSSGFQLSNTAGILSYTPDDQNGFYYHVDPIGTNSLSEVSQQSSSADRIRTYNSFFDKLSFSYPPPLYDDIGFNSQANFRWDAKYALAIHCVSCQKFGLVAPVFPCAYNVNHKTQNRNAVQTCYDTIPRGCSNESMIIGRTVVRTKCASSSCSHPVACHFCTLNDIFYPVTKWLPSFDYKEGSNFISKKRLFCETCDKRFCNNCIMKHSWVLSKKEMASGDKKAQTRFINNCGCIKRKKHAKKSQASQQKRAKD